MKLYIFVFLSIAFTCSSCGQDLLQTKSETLGSYYINNSNFYINISKIGGGSTSSDFMQIRRIYKDSTYDIVKNIHNVDSIVMFKCALDTVNLIVRGRLAADYIKNDTINFSINDVFISERRKVKN